MRRLWARLCPRCLADDAGPVAMHPALQMMQRTESRLDRMLAMLPDLRHELEPDETGAWTRDMIAGTYGTEDRPR